MIAVNLLIPFLTLLSVTVSASDPVPDGGDGKAFKMVLSSTPGLCLGDKGTETGRSLYVRTSGCEGTVPEKFEYRNGTKSIIVFDNINTPIDDPHHRHDAIEARKTTEENSEIVLDTAVRDKEGQKWEFRVDNRVTIVGGDQCLSVIKNATSDSLEHNYAILTKKCGTGPEKPEDDVHQVWDRIYVDL